MHTSPDRCLPRATGLEFSQQPDQNPGALPQSFLKSVLKRVLNLRLFLTRELHSSKFYALDGGVDLYFFVIRCRKRGKNRPCVSSISPGNYRRVIESATLPLKNSGALFIQFSVTSILTHIKCLRVFSQITNSPRALTRKRKKKSHTSPDRCLPRGTGLKFSQQPD